MGFHIFVAPLVGAWIEIEMKESETGKIYVAPLVGAWIEIILTEVKVLSGEQSLPLWERGLKYLDWFNSC